VTFIWNCIEVLYVTIPPLPLSAIPDRKHTCSTNPSHQRSCATHRGLPTGLQPDCLSWSPYRSAFCFDFPLSSFIFDACV